MNTARILIIRLGSLGDIIHTLPAFAAIRKAFPRTEVDWLVDVRHRDLLELVSGVTQRIAVDTSRPASLLEVVRTLRRRRYDVALDLQGLLKSAALARLSGARRCIGFSAPLLRERPAALFYTEASGDAEDHVIDKNLSTLKALGIRMPAVEFPIEVRDTSAVAAARGRLGLAAQDRFAIINPGAAWPNKRWPPVYFAEVARELLRRYRLRSLVLWGPGEEQAAETIAAASDNSAVVSPKTTVADLFALSRAAALMISGDTGPIHIAGAVGTPLVGIFGPTNPVRNGPWSEDDLTVSRFTSCSCRYQRQCRIAGWCLLDISPREVLDLVDRRLTAARSNV